MYALIIETWVKKRRNGNQKIQKKIMTPTWLEHATFRSGVGRATSCATESYKSVQVLYIKSSGAGVLQLDIIISTNTFRHYQFSTNTFRQNSIFDKYISAKLNSAKIISNVFTSAKFISTKKLGSRYTRQKSETRKNFIYDFSRKIYLKNRNFS